MPAYACAEGSPRRAGGASQPLYGWWTNKREPSGNNKLCAGPADGSLWEVSLSDQAFIRRQLKWQRVIRGTPRTQGCLVSLDILWVNYSQPWGSAVCLRKDLSFLIWSLSMLLFWARRQRRHVIRSLGLRKGGREGSQSSSTERASWGERVCMSGEAGLSLETDVKQECVCLTSALQQASWRRNLPQTAASYFTSVSRWPTFCWEEGSPNNKCNIERSTPWLGDLEMSWGSVRTASVCWSCFSPKGNNTVSSGKHTLKIFRYTANSSNFSIQNAETKKRAHLNKQKLHDGTANHLLDWQGSFYTK